MDIKGNWEVAKVFTGFDDNCNLIYITKEELDKQKTTQKNKEAKMFSKGFLKIDDENIRMYLKFDSEAELKKFLDANADEETPVIEDGMLFLEEIKIIKKGNKLYFSSGYDSENDKELLEPLLIEDGLLNVMFTLYRRV